MKLFKHILIGLMAVIGLAAIAGNSQKKAYDTFSNKREPLSKDMLMHQEHTQKGQEATQVQMTSYKKSSMHNVTNSSEKNVNGENLYTVTCTFQGDYEYPDFFMYNENITLNSLSRDWDPEGMQTYTFYNVPEGKYDIIVEFYNWNPEMRGRGHIVHEEVNITSDQHIQFSQDELTETIILRPLLMDGTIATLPNHSKDNVAEQPNEPNSDFINLDYTLLREDHKKIVYSANTATDDNNADEYIFTNKLSDKYHLVFTYYIRDMENQIQISTSEIKGMKTGIYHNYIKDFNQFDCPVFSSTPLLLNEGRGKFKLCVIGKYWIDDFEYGEVGEYVTTDNPLIYVATQPSLSESIDLKTAIVTSNIQFEKMVTFKDEFEEWTSLVREEMFSLPAIYNGNKWEYINQNHSLCGNWAYQKPEEGPVFEYPGVPEYCYFSDQITQPIGNSSPILVTMSQTIEDYDGIIFRSFNPQAYVGRYGETRNCDFWELQTEVSLNGEQVYTSNSGKFLDNWYKENATNGHEKGIIEITFTNRNVLVDETISGSNITTIKIDEKNEDFCSPNIQMLIFKNTDGAITDRFENGADGIIEFSAGDFNYSNSGNNWYYTCDEADVKVEYAAYGEDNFMPLEVEEIPENFFMPGFGYFYRGSLADVTMPTSNGWYDLRFTLTDKAGNEMVQRISPAFKIEGNTSVGAMTIDGIKVWSANGNIFANGAEIASMSLYSADGKLINTSNGTTLPTNGYHGIAIVKVTNSHGETTTHKTTVR